MAACGVEPKRLRLVTPRSDRAPSLVLVEGRRGGNPGLAIEPPLILQDDTGADSKEIQRIYHMETTP
jgi:tRNA1Val (adenine37-N6)-methyltransferase